MPFSYPSTAYDRAGGLLCGGGGGGGGGGGDGDGDGDGDRDRLRKVGQFLELSFARRGRFKAGWTS